VGTELAVDVGLPVEPELRFKVRFLKRPEIPLGLEPPVLEDPPLALYFSLQVRPHVGYFLFPLE